jgi:hypothetical protein
MDWGKIKYTIGPVIGVSVKRFENEVGTTMAASFSES